MKNRASELSPNYRCTRGSCDARVRELDYCSHCDTCDKHCECYRVDPESQEIDFIASLMADEQGRIEF